jgi:hypothetical protein
MTREGIFDQIKYRIFLHKIILYKGI